MILCLDEEHVDLSIFEVRVLRIVQGTRDLSRVVIDVLLTVRGPPLDGKLSITVEQVSLLVLT